MERRAPWNGLTPVEKADGSGLRRLARGITRWQWLLVAFLIPSAVFITAERSPVLLALPALWMLRKVGCGRAVPRTALDVSALLLLLMVLVSTLVTYDLASSLVKVVGILVGVALFYAVADASGRSARGLWIGVAIQIGAGLGVAALALVAVDWRAKLPFLSGVLALLPQRVLDVPGSNFGINPNEVAGVLLWMAPLALSLALGLTLHTRRMQSSLSGRARLALLLCLWAAAVLMCGVVLLTQSRAALLGMGAGLLLTTVALSGRYRRALALAMLLALIGASVLVWQVGPEAVGDFLFAQAGIEPSASAISSLEGRQEIWSRAIYGIRDFPFTGMGMNTFREVVHVLYPLFLIPPDTDIAHAHNHFLQAALDLGLPGLVAYLALWLGAAGMLWRSWQQARLLQFRILAVAFAASLLAYFVYGMVDAVALGARPGFLFWLLLGLVAAQHALVTRHVEAGPTESLSM